MQKYKAVDEFMDSLPTEKRSQVELLRGLILQVEPLLQEHIKWNAPSYIFNGEDRITFNLINKQDVVKLIFHMGATRQENKKGIPVMDDESGLIEWSSDIRGVATFTSVEDINSRSSLLKTIIRNWLSISPSA